MTDLNGNASKLANNVMLTLIARGAMILATASLPIAGWMLERSVATIDNMAAKIDTIRDQTIETGGAIKLIQQSQTVQGQILADHEARVRALESINRSRSFGSPP